MPHDPKTLYKLGGAAWIASGLLFLVRAVLELIAGPPPSSGAEILAWVESERLALDFVSEILFFATIALVPAVVALYCSLAGTHRAKAVAGCGIFAVAIPLLAVLLVVHGRLVYPIYGIRVNSPAVAEFTIAIFYGGFHAVLLILAFATFILSLAMMHGVYGRPIAYLGFVTSVLDVAGSYPDLIGPTLNFGCQVFFTAWFVAVGVKLVGMSRQIA